MDSSSGSSSGVLKVKIGFGVGLLLLISLYAVFLGAFKKVEVGEKEIGPFVMVYESHTGSYLKTDSAVQRLLQFAEKNSLSPALGFAMYLDDPEQVPEKDLRSEAGILLDEKSAELLQKLLGPDALNRPSASSSSQGSSPSSAEPVGVLPIQWRPYPQVRAVVGEFPLKGQLSRILGARKVLPRLKEFMLNLNYPPAYSVEIYDFEQKKITYAFPVVILH